MNELHTLDNIWPLLPPLHSHAPFLSIPYITGIRTGSHFSHFVTFLLLFCPSIQAQLSKAQEETGTLKLQLQTVSPHVYEHTQAFSVCVSQTEQIVFLTLFNIFEQTKTHKTKNKTRHTGGKVYM